ncbi:MAG TPA: beta-phosphoglucomutase family hydrolase [Acidimicrobiales bacterium]|nr:beta-phosphoglucomutase family hydrolase [Acidimicrobiales bacterium]
METGPRGQEAAVELGLPPDVRACLFDLDGVLTRTATVHAAAWKEMFDEFLAARAREMVDEPRPFTSEDYDRYVDGRPRLDGTRAFLASRGIGLPEGDPSDPPGAPTVHGLSTRKNDLVLARLADHVEVYEGSMRYVRAVRGAGLRTAVVSSSANAKAVLDVAHIADLFDHVVDGQLAQARGLHGKPAPDTFLAAAEDLGAGPGEAAVYEDAIAGVEAGRAGGFARVVGVDRVGQADALREHGADVVVSDLAELLDGQAAAEPTPRREG